MSEENSLTSEPENSEWEAPPPPEQIEPIKEDPPQMSEIGTLGNIFIEPGETFADLRRKPRFIIAGIIIALLTTGFLFSFQKKVGEENIRRFVTRQAEKNSQFAALPADQKKRNIDIQMTIQKVVTYALPVIFFILFFIGGFFYWVGSKALGGSTTFMGAVSVWVYSSFPPTVIATVANFVILFLKSTDEIDIGSSQRGLIKANPTMFFDGKEMPVLTTLISTLDVFVIWGLVLAAIGLHKVGKLSKGGAWGVVLFVTLIGLTWRVFSAYLNGIPA